MEKQYPVPSPHPHHLPTPADLLPFLVALSLPSLLPVPSFLTFLSTPSPESPKFHPYLLSLSPFLDKNMETPRGESICLRPHFHLTSTYKKSMPVWVLVRETASQPIAALLGHCQGTAGGTPGLGSPKRMREGVGAGQEEVVRQVQLLVFGGFLHYFVFVFGLTRHCLM